MPAFIVWCFTKKEVSRRSAASPRNSSMFQPMEWRDPGNITVIIVVLLSVWPNSWALTGLVITTADPKEAEPRGHELELLSYLLWDGVVKSRELIISSGLCKVCTPTARDLPGVLALSVELGAVARAPAALNMLLVNVVLFEPHRCQRPMPS
ncbi:hypothetical protein BD779DRAFT_486229 [Infundibulicybe gibba]|nr:hypothetical protein BD779DRAFT_486229 [Infundibulicybe gibba]